jgi:uncharacterized protein (TIGR00255 family)
MIRSMTGFGTAVASFQTKTITIEIKSVNSKFFDLTLRLPPLYREKEFELRGELVREIERGKVDLTISIDAQDVARKSSVNRSAFKSYLEELKGLRDEFETGPSDLMSLILTMPDVMNNDRQNVSEDEWKAVKKVLGESLHAFGQFRMAEGASMQKDLVERIRSIEEKVVELEAFEAGRTELVRKKLTVSLEEFIQANNIDRNRIEQELIFYVEKFDVSEEKVRLRSHCSYFMETLNSASSNGKKLAFISQEIGREINTIGSKANDAEMQKTVVLMKDELEKVKELLLNVL